jgi:hypothetical protein
MAHKQVAQLNDEELARIETDAIIADAMPEEVVVDMAAAISEANGGVPVEAEAPDEAEAPIEAQNDDLSFAERIDAVSQEQTEHMLAALSTGFANRATFEREKSGWNDNIQKTISKAVTKFAAVGIAKQMVAANANGDFMNESEVSGKRRNVYAFDKLHDLLAGASRGHMNNAINQAVAVSLVRCADVKLPFTMEIAKAAASDKCALPVAYVPYMRRHTVSASTASTQASSTMTALEVLGIVKNVGSHRMQVFELVDCALTRALVDHVRKAYLVNMAA